MNFDGIVDAVKTASFGAVRLAVKDRQLAREYWSETVRRYNELNGSGLPPGDPVEYIYTRGWAARSPGDRVQLPMALDTAGGTRLDELVVLASVARSLQPVKVFEIGTFMGRTTSVFILNAPDARVYSVDLPPDAGSDGLRGKGYIDTDARLVDRRRVGSFLIEAGLGDRYTQLLCDSRNLDPSPHAASVELAFIDGAHALEYVRSDTEKMATMMADRGLVFWHDYGGKGRFHDLTTYLEGLAGRIDIYGVRGTTLAWAPGRQLRMLFGR
jgi:methyltransferase family protein